LRIAFYHRQAEIYERQAEIMDNARRGENLVKVIELLQSKGNARQPARCLREPVVTE